MSGKAWTSLGHFTYTHVHTHTLTFLYKVCKCYMWEDVWSANTATLMVIMASNDETFLQCLL